MRLNQNLTARLELETNDVRSVQAASIHRGVVAVLVCSLALAGLPARAAPTPVSVVVTPNASFAPGSAEYPATLEVAEGGTLLYTNLDYSALIASSWGWHSILSYGEHPDGTPLFESAFIGFGQTTPVEGVEALPVGTYAFYCQSHGDLMSGSLTVVPRAA